MALYLKNTTVVLKQWGGIEIAAAGSYTVQDVDRLKLLSDVTFLSDLTAGYAVINDGVGDVAALTGVTLLRFQNDLPYEFAPALSATRQANGKTLIDAPVAYVGNSQSFDDFDFSSLGANANPYNVNGVSGLGGSVAVETTTSGNDHQGILTLSTGTSNNLTGVAAVHFYGGNNIISLGGMAVSFEWRVFLPTLSTAGVHYMVRLGLFDTTASGVPANGVYLQYTHDVNSGKWQGVCTASSTSSTTDTGVTTLAGVWIQVRADVNAAGTSAQFYVNGVATGSPVTANIPTSGMRWMCKIEKQAPAITTARTMLVDYCGWRFFR